MNDIEKKVEELQGIVEELLHKVEIAGYREEELRRRIQSLEAWKDEHRKWHRNITDQDCY